MNQASSTGARCRKGSGRGRIGIALAVLLAVLLVPAPIAPAHAQVERLDLRTMLARTDDAVAGEIVGRRVFRTDDPVAGAELWFTELLVRGRSLRGGAERTVSVLHPGGMDAAGRGVHNSEAPSADDERVGSRVVVFFRHADDLGGGVSGNALYASHAGLYRTVEGPSGTVVLGRGAGYALRANRRLADLEPAVRTLHAELEGERREAGERR